MGLQHFQNVSKVSNIFYSRKLTQNMIFHDRNNEYAGDKMKPIPVNTILTLDSEGKIINEWGKNMFFLPHMLTVDKQNNVWVTDVAMHQVFKFAPYGGNTGKDGKKMPLIVLGTPVSAVISSVLQDIF